MAAAVADNGPMGLTRAQKIKRYGEKAGGGSAQGEQSAPNARPSARRNTELPMPEPTEAKRRPGILIAVVMIIGVLLLFYVNVLILPEFAAVAAQGHGLPEWQFTGYDAEWFAGFTQALGQDGPGLYASVHWSTGLLAPLVTAAGWALFFVVYARRGYERISALTVTALFLIVYLLGNVAVDAAVAGPEWTGWVAASSVLMSTRWVLLVVLIFVTASVLLRKVREQLQDFDPVAANDERRRTFRRR